VQKVRESKSATEGFNAATGVYEDMIKSGVVDPAKVVRSALQTRGLGVLAAPHHVGPHLGNPRRRRRMSVAAPWTTWAAWVVWAAWGSDPPAQLPGAGAVPKGPRPFAFQGA
jgi:hypothetical protein